ncbi:uncharacterized protein I206_101669 [Kwoniella pini CBS 10737]|uniref:Fe2OG dioxygenase domain-containing protein n=1 Tax=Kwoniella pini CBS 10737 TaxID=1296096 RepID=A0A1B9HW25_9TREE|nr:uncharacterized protein I206_06362 [Kwoniella pini CBS 10737]OCF47461.1 hypothetical protein I206_06362 [Kwoniella pini CBS 10737]
MSHRAYLTKDEVVKVDQLERSYKSQEGVLNFACSGVFPSHVIASANLALYYVTPDEGKAPRVIKYAMLPITNEVAKDIHGTATTSPFGRGSELVYDDSYRQARELKPPYFSLTSDILSASSLLTLLAKKLNYDSPLEARMNKLNAYTEGGFFKAHKDTPQSEHHIGTLIICLPTPFTGGDLVIRQMGASVTFDWSNQVQDGSITWGFLYSDCEHEVLPVTSGTRVTISYDIFVSKDVKAFDQSVMDTRLQPLLDTFETLLKDAKFLISGGTLAFGLVHDYPFGENDRGFPGDLRNRLKDSDAVLVSAIEKLGLEMEYFAIYDYESSCYEVVEERPIDEADAKAEEMDNTFKRGIWIADDVHKCNRDHCIYDDTAEELGLKQDLDLIWVTFPASYDTKNSYITFGNEPQAATVYCAVGVKVEIPKASTRLHQKPIPRTAKSG